MKRFCFVFLLPVPLVITLIFTSNVAEQLVLNPDCFDPIQYLSLLRLEILRKLYRIAYGYWVGLSDVPVGVSRYPKIGKATISILLSLCSEK